MASSTNYRSLDQQQDPLLEGSIFVDEANNTVPYTLQKREYGRGDLRLGTSIQLDENIYTVAFLAELNNQEIDAVTQEDQGKPPEQVGTRSTPRGTIIGFTEDFDENDPRFLEAEAAMISWEKATIKRYETYKMERTKLHIHIFVCIFSQILLITLLFNDAVGSFNIREIVLENTDTSLLISKGICSFILHLTMLKNVT